MKNRILPFALISGSCLGVLFSCSVQAQIVPDRTLPNNSIVNENGNTSEITGGTSANNNLFHSFEQFSIPTGGEAFFNNPANIENIFTRVTGKSISNIDGLIRANGTANLFLLNPNGILFGTNASLDIGGSFIATTADSFRWSNGSEFSAVDPQAPPLLTMNVPVGLQYGSNPGSIVVQGTGNNLELDFNFEILRDFRPLGLEVKPGQTLALAGGDISLEGGNLTAAGGRIELWSVRNGQVSVTDNNGQLQLSNVSASDYGNIQLVQASSIDTSSLEAGNIHLQGGNLSVTDGSVILSYALGSNPGGNIAIDTSESVNVQGISEFTPVYSGIFADVASSGSGKGGTLTIKTPFLRVADGSQLSASTFGQGNAGTLDIQADTVEVFGANIFNATGLLSASLGGSGNGGIVKIDANRFSTIDGGQVFVGTFGAGNGGTIVINASEVELRGVSSEDIGAFPSGIFADTLGTTGKGGNIFITSDRLQIADNATIGVNTFSAGNGGNITINTDSFQITNGGTIEALTASSGDAGLIAIKAEAIEVIGESFRAASGIQAIVQPEATGKGGEININTNNLRLVDGAQIAVSTAGSGNAGGLIVNADSIELTGRGLISSTASGLFASAIVDTGEGGDINITTDNLIVQDGATISVSNFFSNNDVNVSPGQGAAGNINLQANTITLNNQGTITANTVAGDKGNITLQAQNIQLSQGSQIDTNASFDGSGGSINILNANALTLKEDSVISANAEGLGSAGNIQIQANNINLEQSRVTATGNQGNISLRSQALQVSQNSAIATNASGNNSGGSITLDANNLAVRAGSKISSNAEGSGSAGNINVQANAIALEQGNITATGNQGNLNLTSEEIQLHQGSQISTNAQGNNSGGNINITAEELEILENSVISANAIGQGSGGNVNIAAFSPNTLLLDRGRISATGGQGNITLQSPLILLRRGSQISTNGQGTSPGGNIIIDSDFLVAVPQENSDITANAQQSFGGRVIISTQGLFGITPQSRLTPFSDITATSELGSQFSGVVQIIDPNVDPTSGAVKLPSEIVDASNQIVAGCAADEGNTFVVTGRGGLPENPSQPLRGQAVWQDWRELSGGRRQQATGNRQQLVINSPRPRVPYSPIHPLPPSPRHPSPDTRHHTQITEAQGWVVENDGKVRLVTNAAKMTPQSFWQSLDNCQKVN